MRRQRDSFENSREKRTQAEARASTRRRKNPWKTRAPSRSIRTACKLQAATQIFFFLFAARVHVQQLVFASELNADLNTKRAILLLLETVGSERFEILNNAYTRVLQDFIETKRI